MGDSLPLSLAPWKDQDPLVVVSAHDPAGMARQVAECQTWNLRLCYDVGQQATNSPATDIKAGIKTAAILIANEYEMTTISSRTGIDVKTLEAPVPVVVSTFGKQGS